MAEAKGKEADKEEQDRQWEEIQAKGVKEQDKKDGMVTRGENIQERTEEGREERNKMLMIHYKTTEYSVCCTPTFT